MFLEDIKLTIFILCVGLFVILFLSSIQVVVAQEEIIIFTEIMYDLDGSDDGNEWVEIYNNSSENFVIDPSWRFYDGSNHVLNIVQGDESFDSGEILVIVDSADDFLITYPEFSGTLIDSVVKLNNTGEEIKLSLDEGETWTTIASYTSDMGAAGDGYTLELVDNTWQSSIKLNGSPGIYEQSINEDDSCPTLEDLLAENENTEVVENETEDTEVVEEDNNKDIDSNNSEDITTNEVVDSSPEDIEQGSGSGGVIDLPIIYSDKVRINEIVPDPDGPDQELEYIELYNFDTQVVDLIDWYIKDASDKKYVIEGDIEGGGYIVLYRPVTNITLNNSSGDHISLFNPSKELVYEVSYDESVASHSYSYFDNGWQWTSELTPGATNTLPVVEETIEEEIVEEVVESVSIEEAVALELQLISDIKDLEVGSKVYTQGVVTVLPGHFASSYFYISEIDFDDNINLNMGIQIYSYNREFPDLNIGDHIIILGKTSSARGELRIKTSTPEDIQVIDSLHLPKPINVLTGEVNDDYEGGLISVDGDLIDKKSSSWYLDDDSGEIRVYINSNANITKPQVELGQEVFITGIVGETKSGFRLLPRFDEDIRVEQVIVEEVEPEVTVVSPPEQNIIEVVDENEGVTEDYLGYGLGVVGLTMLSWVLKLKFM